MRPRGHQVSAHRAKVLESCERQFLWAYGPRELQLRPDPPSLPMRTGDVVHRGIARLVADRASWGTWGPTNEREVLAALDSLTPTEFHAESLLAARALAPEIVRRVSPYLDDLELSPLDHADGGAWVERSFVRELGDAEIDLASGAVAVRVGGIFDLVLSSADGKRVRVVDWKTGGGSFLGEKDAKRDPQVLLYLAASASLWPDADEIDLHLVWIGLDASPTVVRWSLELDDAAVALARGAVRRIATETEWPARPGEACSRCSFTRYCEDRRDWIAAGTRAEGSGRVAFRDVTELDDEDLAAVVEDRSARAKEAEREADLAKAAFRARVEARGTVVARGRKHFLRVVAAGKPKLEAPAPRQAYDRLASEPVDENMAPVAGASTRPFPSPISAPATGPLSLSFPVSDVEAVNRAAGAEIYATKPLAWPAGSVPGACSFCLRPIDLALAEDGTCLPCARETANAFASSVSDTIQAQDAAFQREVLERAKARTAAWLEAERERIAKNTPGDVAGPGPVAAPARPTSATTPPTLPAEDAPALSAGGVSLPETDEDPYLETLTRQVEDEIAAEEATSFGESDTLLAVEEPDPRHDAVTPWAEKQGRNGFLPSPPKGGLPW